MIAMTPIIRRYCGTTDLLLNDQMEQVNARIPNGPNIFTANIIRLSQSRPMNLPEQSPENGQTAKANSAIDARISSHARVLNIHISSC